MKVFLGLLHALHPTFRCYCLGRRVALGKSIVLCLAIASASAFVDSCPATIREWVAENTDSGNWSEPGNWRPAGVPQDGDDLIFDLTEENQFPRQTMHNDLVGLRIRRLEFCSDGWSLDGNELTLLQRAGYRLTNTCGDSSFLFTCPLKLGAATLMAISEAGGTLIVRGNIDLNGYTLSLSSGDQIIVSGQITGNGNVIATVDSFGHDSKIIFDGPTGNTFNGKLTVRQVYDFAGEVVFDKQFGNVVNDALVLGNRDLTGSYRPSVCRLARSHQIGDNAEVRVADGSQFLLDGHTETIGSLCLTNAIGAGWSSLVDTGDGMLSVQGGITATNDATLALPTIRGKLGLPPGSHTISVGGIGPRSLNIEAQIIGGGGLTKRGPGNLLLSGNNTFEGDAVLQEGAVSLYHGHALGNPSGAVILDGGELDLEGVAVSLKTLWVNRTSANVGGLGGRIVASGISSWAGPVTLNTDLLVAGTSMSFSGAMSGPGGLNLFNGTTHLEGPDANTYEGLTFMFCRVLELNKPAGVRAISSKMEVHSGGGGNLAEVRWQQDYQCVGVDVELFTGAFINLNNHWDDFGPVTFNSGAISTGTGELGIYGLVKVNFSETEATISGRLGLPPGLHEFRVSDGPAFPDLRVDATVLGAGHLRKTGPGQMWLAASNSYQGLTTVAEGALSVLNPYGLGASGAGTTVDDGATLELNFAGGSMPEPLAIRGTGIFGNGALGAFGDVTLRTPFPSIYAAIDLTTNTTIAVADGARLTVDGFISGIGPLTKAGRGLLVLANSNPNTYSGDTIVADGVLNLSKPNSAISVPGDLIVGPAPLNSTAIARWSTPGGMNSGAIATINAGSLLDLNGNDQSLSRLNLNDGGDAQTGAGKLSFPVGGVVNVGSLSMLGSHDGSTITGNIGLPPNATLTFGVSAFAPSPPFYLGPELDVNASIPAPVENVSFERAGLTKTGSGRMRLIGNNSFRGWVDIGEGAVIAANSTALGAVYFLSGTYVFNSGALQLEGGVNIEGETLVMNSTATPALEGLFGESYWSGQVTLSRDSSIGAGLNSLLQLAGVIAGTGNLTKVGAGTLRFGGGDHNTYAGETRVNEGILLMSKPTGITAIPGSLNIGTPAGLPAVAANLTSYQVIGNIFVNRNGLLNLNGQVENVDHLWLSEGGDVETTTGVLFLKSGGSIQVVPGSLRDPATISGNLDMDQGSHILNVGSSTSGTPAPNLEIPALMTSSLGAVSLQKNGAGTLHLTANNSYSGSTTIAGGVLQVDGSQPGSSMIVRSGTLMGVGRVGAVDFVSSGGIAGVIAPGRSPGVLSCGAFNLGVGGGTLRMELNGRTPGTGHDQLYIRGLFTAAILDGVVLDASLNFASAVDDQFTIIRKDGNQAVGGQFSGLPEGANFYIGGEQFTITYVGGDGNDVVLTRIPTPPRPALIIQRLPPSSVRLLWPTNDPAFSLQFNTNLSSTNPSGWTFVAETPAITGTNNVVTQNAAGVLKLYRLFKP